jgi:hypothetical protein
VSYCVWRPGEILRLRNFTGFTSLIDFTSLSDDDEPMNVEAPFIAEMVLSQGNIQIQPLNQALCELAEAVRDQQQNRPFGAVIGLRDRPLEVLLVWRRYLDAFDQARSALGAIHFNDPTEISRAKTLRPGIEVISCSLDLQPGLSAFPSQRDASGTSWSPPKVLDDVLLVMSGDQLASAMKVSTARIGELRVLLLVRAQQISRGSIASANKDPAASDADDHDNTADGPTLSWRKAFMQEVLTWSADEVAEQGGYGAKNKSAAATRWTKDGKIFSVLYGGKQHYPQFQFKQGKPRPIVAQILKALGEDATGWDRAFFFATPNSYLSDERPMDRLNDKSTEELLVQVAARHAHPADIF